MRTIAEIVQKIKAWEKNGDFFGVKVMDLLEYLPWSDAKPFLIDEAKEEEWKCKSLDAMTVKTEMYDYMPFAWEKANDCRGLSSLRSLDHYHAWLWLLEDETFIELIDYEYYGKPILKAICDKYGWGWREWDDGRWRNSEKDEGVPVGVALGK